jgi:hypothetical protein
MTRHGIDPRYVGEGTQVLEHVRVKSFVDTFSLDFNSVGNGWYKPSKAQTILLTFIEASALRWNRWLGEGLFQDDDGTNLVEIRVMHDRNACVMVWYGSGSLFLDHLIRDDSHKDDGGCSKARGRSVPLSGRCLAGSHQRRHTSAGPA